MENFKHWWNHTGTAVAIALLIAGLTSYIIIGNQQAVKLKLANQNYLNLALILLNDGRMNQKELSTFLGKNETSAILDRTKPDLTLPFDVNIYYYPFGWIGDGSLSKKQIVSTRSGNQIKISYTPGGETWAGVYWQYPANNFGASPGRNLIGARQLTFWAKGETGKEIIEFKSGGIQGKKYGDSFEKSIGKIELTREWKKYVIDLTGEDLSSVVGAFAWTAARDDNKNGATFYLTKIQIK